MIMNIGAARFFATLLALAAQVALIAGQVRADDMFSPTSERVRLSLGVMHIASTTTLRIDSSNGLPGTEFNAESAFGLAREKFEPKFQAMVRAGTRHRLSFDYFTLDRTASTTVDRTIAFRDVVLLPTDPLRAELSLRTFGITYGYSFWHSETLELAGTLGVHATDISSSAKVQSATRHISQAEDQAGPVPTLGIDATWVASKRFYLDARGQYLQLHVNHLDGSLGFYNLDVLYRYRPNVSFGLGFAYVRAHLAKTQGSQAGLFNFITKGPEAFFRIAF